MFEGAGGGGGEGVILRGAMRIDGSVLPRFISYMMHMRSVHPVWCCLQNVRTAHTCYATIKAVAISPLAAGISGSHIHGSL